MGTILPYIGALNDIPHGWFFCDGTNGTPDLRDRFLEGSTFPKQFIKPGLPNITGDFWVHTYLNGAPFGAFYSKIDRGRTHGYPEYDDYTYTNIILNASRCSAVYGNSDTVQPAAYTVYYIIRLK